MLFPIEFGGPQIAWLSWKANTKEMMPKDRSPLYCRHGAEYIQARAEEMAEQQALLCFTVLRTNSMAAIMLI